MNSAPPAPRGVLALHGFWGCASDWSGLQQKITTLTPLKWVCPELPGHGKSPTLLTEFSISSFVNWCLETSAQHFEKPPVIAGYSLGARIALAAAIEQPTAFCGVILISASPGNEGETERRERRAADAERARRLRGCSAQAEMRQFLLEWWAQPIFSSPRWNAETFAPFAGSRLNQQPAVLARVLEEASPGAQEPLWTQLAALRVPVLCIAGEADQKFCAIARRMCSLLPHSELSIIAGSGHSLLLENPPALATAISDWFDRLPDKARSA